MNVTQLDIPASNGYIHHIDGLLTSESLLPLLPRRCDVISQRTVRVSPPVQDARIYTHHRHLLLLLSPKADTHFTVPQKVEG